MNRITKMVVSCCYDEVTSTVFVLILDCLFHCYDGLIKSFWPDLWETNQITSFVYLRMFLEFFGSGFVVCDIFAETY